MPRVNVNNTELYYEESGDKTAPAILLAHSLFLDHKMFEHQIAAFSRSYRVVAYDQRGHGRSPHPYDGDYDMDRLSEDSAELIKRLGLGPAHLVGNSMGGFVAIRLAARRPELVRSVAVLGSSSEHEHKAQEFRPLVEALKANGGAAVVDSLMYIMFGDTSLSDPAKAGLRSRWRAHLAALPRTIGDAAHAVVERRGVIDELRDVVMPIVAIAGAEDHAYSVALSKNIAEAAPDGSYVVVESTGHSVALESPVPVNVHLLAHFRRADTKRATGASA